MSNLQTSRLPDFTCVVSQQNAEEHPFDHAPPAASALLESLRGLGYSTHTAIADLIDNSIAAGARTVHVEFLWNGLNSVLRIVDDGRGMDEAALLEAMRPGGRHPHPAVERAVSPGTV